MRVDALSLKALKRISETSDGRVLHSLLVAELVTIMASLMKAPVEKVPSLQGQAQATNDLIKLLEINPAAT